MRDAPTEKQAGVWLDRVRASDVEAGDGLSAYISGLERQIGQLRETIRARDPLERLIERHLDPAWDRVVSVAEKAIQADESRAAAEVRLAEAIEGRTAFLRALAEQAAKPLGVLAVAASVYALARLGVDVGALFA